MPPKTQRFCIYCGGSPLTGEHLYSEWTHPLLIDRAQIGRADITSAPIQTDAGIGLGFRTLNRKSERVISVKANVVCGDCNHEWMSGLETETIVVLSPLIRGDRVTISSEDQHILSKWITNKFIVLDAMKYETSVVSDEQRDKFFRLRIPLDNSLIYVARQKSQEWWTSWQRGYVSIAVKEAVDTEVNDYVSTLIFGIGKILFVVFYSTIPNFIKVELKRTRFDGRIHQIFPGKGVSINWPSKGGLSDVDVGMLSAVFPQAVAASPFGLDLKRERRRLSVVTRRPDASVLKNFAPNAPTFYGSEFVDLECGNCGATLTRGVSQETIRDRFVVKSQLLIACTSCGSDNEIPVRGTTRKSGEK